MNLRPLSRPRQRHRRTADAARAAVWGIALASIFFGAHPSARQAQSSVPRLAPGTHVQTLRIESGPSVSYAISVPRDYTESGGVPLILALHFGVGGGAGRGAGLDVLRLLVGPALADIGAVVIAPDSLGGSWDEAANEQAAMRLLDETLKTYRADPKKVAVTGFSMGGRGTWHFAAKFPDRFSAALPVAGRPPEDAGDWRTPVFAVHSRRDERVPIAPTIARIGELEKKGLNAQLVVLEEPTHFQTNLYSQGLRQAVPWLKALWGR